MLYTVFWQSFRTVAGRTGNLYVDEWETIVSAFASKIIEYPKNLFQKHTTTSVQLSGYFKKLKKTTTVQNNASPVSRSRVIQILSSSGI